MENGIENLYATDPITDMCSNIGAMILDIFSAIDNALNKTIDKIKDFDNELIRISSVVSVSDVHTDYGLFPQTAPVEVSNNDKTEHSDNIIAQIGAVSKFGAKMVSTAAEITELSETVKRAGDSFGIISKISDGAMAAGKVFSTAGEGISMVAATEAGSEIIAGAMAIAEGGAAFGPVGWAVGAGALVAGTIGSIAFDDSREEKNVKDEGNRVRVENALATFAMNDTEAGAYLNYEPKFRKSYKEQEEWAKALKKYKPVEIASNFPVPQPQNTHSQHPFLGSVPKQQDSDRVTFQKSFTDISASIINDLIATGEINGLGAVNRKINQLYQRIGKDGYNKQYAEYTRSAVRIAKGHLLDEAGNGFIEEGQKPRYTSIERRGESQTKQIVINLNKPMIGSFTINTKEVKEGMNDFKRKVEAVLLEILNSANVIQ